MLRIINSIMKTTVESIINGLDQIEARTLAGEDEVKGDIQSRSSGGGVDGQTDRQDQIEPGCSRVLGNDQEINPKKHLRLKHTHTCRFNFPIDLLDSSLSSRI